MGRVLFVDDDLLISRFYIKALAAEGIESLAIGSADEAVHVFQANDDIDAVILDLMMPPPSSIDLDEVEHGLVTGLWILREIREQVSSRGIPIIILTNLGVDSVRARIPDLGLPDELLQVRAKSDTPPRYLADTVVEMLKDKKESQ